jgi:hypothetical protein
MRVTGPAGACVRFWLRGAKPTDLPVEQQTSSSWSSICKPQKRWAMKVPPALVLRADKVIE